MGTTSVGEIGLDLVVNQNQFKKQMTGIAGLAKKAGATLAAAFAVKKIVNFSKECLELGSDLQEVQNIVDVTFPTMTAQVDKFAKSAAASFGLSEAMAKRYSAMFGTMAKQTGFSEKAAYDMGTTLAGLAGDVASFYDMTQDEAYTKLKAVFSGETEVLKDIGIVMTQNALDAYAMANGYGKATQAMTEAEKVALRYAFVQEQLSAATGDFVRTSGSWANQVRILKLQFDSLKASIGQGLINLFTPVLKVINTLLGHLTTLANAFKSFTELITGKKSSGSSSVASPVSDLVSTAQDAGAGLSGASDSAKNLGDATKGVGSAAKKAAKEMRALMGFDKINKLSEQDSVDDSGSSSPTSGAGGSGGVGGAVDYGNLAEGDTVLDKLDDKFAALIKRAKELADLFKKGFKIGFGDSDKKIESIKKHLEGIGNSLKNIFTDKEVVSAANRLLDAVALNAGKVAGSMASIGLTVADNLVGGIDKYLAGSSGYIKQRIISIFNVSADITNLMGDWHTAFANIFDALRNDAGKNCTAAIIGIFSDGFLGALDLTIKFGENVAKAITQPIVDNQGKIKSAIENTLAPISQVVASLHTGVVDTFTKIHSVYDEHIAPFFKSLADGLSTIAGKFMDAYNGYIAPVLQNLADKFSVVWEKSIQPTIDKAIELIGKIFDVLKLLWENLLVPFLSWLVENIVPVVADIISTVGTHVMDFVALVSSCFGGILDILNGFIDFLLGVFTGDSEKAWSGIEQIVDGFKNIFKAIFDFIKDKILIPFDEFVSGVFKTDWTKNFGALGEVLNAFGKSVSGIWESIKKIFEGIVDFIAGVFTGDWKRAWEGVKSIFSGVWNAFKNIVKSPMNAILGFINSFLRGIQTMVNAVSNALNSISIDLPGWLQDLTGYSSIGFNLPHWSAPQIPYLAQGGYVKPNTPQLAMIGDNRHQGEVVAPEGKLQDMVNTAVKAVAGSGGISKAELESIINNAVMRIIAALGQMGFFIDGQLMAKALQKATEELNYLQNPVKIV